MTQQVEIFLSDLSEEKRKEVIKAVGEEGNYDILPLTVLDFEVFDIDEYRKANMEEKAIKEEEGEGEIEESEYEYKPLHEIEI